MPDDDICHCGDGLDEHDPKTMECLVEGCYCFYYEENPDA